MSKLPSQPAQHNISIGKRLCIRDSFKIYCRRRSKEHSDCNFNANRHLEQLVEHMNTNFRWILDGCLYNVFAAAVVICCIQLSSLLLTYYGD